jgi:basic membrane protein A
LEDPHRSLDLVGHGAPVEDIAFSPEGSHVATVSGDGTLRLWDVASGDEDLALSSAAWGEFKEVAFHPDGKTLAVSDAKGIYILLTYADDLARLARERATRGFSREECRMYLPGEGCAIRPEEEPTVAPYLPPPEGYRGCELSEAGGVYDGGYNQEVYEGILLVSEQLGWDRYVYESEFLDDPPRAMRRLLRSNCDLIVAPGFLFTGLIENAAQRYPDQAFQLIDVSVEDPEDNLWIQLCAPDQAAFLAGYLAASVSQTRTVATFGGLPIQPVLDFMVGFEAGVAHYNNLHSEDVEVLGWDIASGEGEFVGDFCCPPDGIEISQRLIDQGADVVMPVAGPWVGLGGMIAARDNPGVLFIGVDVDQAEATPEYAGVILTSVEKHIRLSVLRAAQAIEAGTFQGGTYIGTLETGEVGLSPFHELDDRVPERVRAELAVIEAQIIAGEIETKP